MEFMQGILGQNAAHLAVPRTLQVILVKDEVDFVFSMTSD